MKVCINSMVVISGLALTHLSSVAHADGQEQLPKPLVFDWSVPAVLSDKDRIDLESELNYISQDFHSHWFASFGESSTFQDPCLIGEFDKVAFTASATTAVFTGTVDIGRCIEVSPGQPQWTAEVSFFMSISCDAEDLSGVDGKVFSEGLPLVEKACIDAKKQEFRVQMDYWATRSLEPNSEGSEGSANILKFRMMSDVSSANNGACVLRRWDDGTYSLANCVNKEKTYSMVVPETESEGLPNYDESYSYRTMTLSEDARFKLNDQVEDLHGVMVEGSYTFRCNNWKGIVTFDGLEEDGAYTAEGTLEGQPATLEGKVRR